MNENLFVILGVELLCAAQGIEFRAPLMTSPRLQRLLKTIRAAVPALGEDRYMADDLSRSAGLVREGHASNACGIRDLLLEPSA